MVKAYDVYILECVGNRLYTGVAVDHLSRFEKHCSGRGAAFTRAFKPIRIVAVTNCPSKSAALKLEYKVKQLSKPEKLRLIQTNSWPV